MLVRNDLNHQVETIANNHFQVLNVLAKVNNKYQIMISAIYKWHDFNKYVKNSVMRELTNINECKHHTIIEDFEINVLRTEFDSKELLNNFLSD